MMILEQELETGSLSLTGREAKVFRGSKARHGESRRGSQQVRGPEQVPSEVRLRSVSTELAAVLSSHGSDFSRHCSPSLLPLGRTHCSCPCTEPWAPKSVSDCAQVLLHSKGTVS